MGDAEIIPIGTRGRPGRGTGAKPSAASRSLAPGARRNGDGPSMPRPKAVRPEPEPQRTQPSLPEPAVSRDKAAPEPDRAPARTEERSPAAGIPFGDWLAAFQ